MNKNTLMKRKNLLSRDEARAIVEPHIETLVDNLEEAWDWVQAILDQDPERRVTFDTSLEATMISQRFILLTRQKLEGQEGIVIKMHGRHMTVMLAGAVNLRFKKFDQKLRSGQVKTNRQWAIYHQDSFIDDPTEITFGYVTTPAGDKIHGVYITCPIGWSRNAWMIALRDPGLGTLPLFTGDDAPDTSEIIVKPRKAKDSDTA